MNSKIIILKNRKDQKNVGGETGIILFFLYFSYTFKLSSLTRPVLPFSTSNICKTLSLLNTIVKYYKRKIKILKDHNLKRVNMVILIFIVHRIIITIKIQKPKKLKLKKKSWQEKMCVRGHKNLLLWFKNKRKH